MALAAKNAANWNDATRHMAMLHCGCPLADIGFGVGKGGRRPSIKHPQNTQRHFELFMALAEASAKAMHRGAMMPRPSHSAGKESWAEVVQDQAAPMRHKIETIWAEAQERLPEQFRPGEPLDKFVQRQTMNDDTRFGRIDAPRTLNECDEAQLYRILEGLKAWIRRALAQHGMRPFSFDNNPRPIPVTERVA
jgi:hypothetical protein